MHPWRRKAWRGASLSATPSGSQIPDVFCPCVTATYGSGHAGFNIASRRWRDFLVRELLGRTQGFM